MTIRQTRRTGQVARLLGGASIAVLMSHGPAMAQVVNIAIDSAVPVQDDAFTAANVTGFDTTANNTQESRAAVTASIADGALTTSDAGTQGSSVDVTENQFTASAQGNLFTLQTQNLGNVGSGTLGVLTGQFADATVSANITGTDATVTGTAAALQSSLDASNNTLTARTSINQASTVFSDDISADLASQLAQSNQSFAGGTNTPETLTRGDFDAQLLNVTGGGSVVANTQAVAGTALASSALIDDSDILIAVTGVATDSALSVDGNELRATLTGNQGVTGTDVSVDTQFNSSAGVFSQQQIGAGAGEVTLSAGVTDSVLAVSLTDATNSSLTVDDNVIGAQARGNVATLDGNGLNGLGNEGTFLNVSANDITAAGTAGGVISVNNTGTLSFSDTVGTASSSFGFLAATQQAIESETAGDGSITATNSETALSVTAATVANSAINVDDNTFFAIASANTGGTGIDLSATSVTASAGLASDQSLINTDVSALLGTSGVPAALTATATGDISDSSITLDDNIFVTEASGNTGRTSLTASADTTLQSSDTNDRGTAELNFIAGTATAAATDFGTIANQSIDANSDINAEGFTSLGVVAGGALDNAVTGNISGSTLSVSDNAQNSTASGNILTNRIALSGNIVGVAGADFATNGAVTTSLGSLQQLGSDVTAGSNTNLSITQAGLGTVAAIDGIETSSLLIDGNDNRARATGNTVDSIVSVTADTAIIGADATAATATATTDTPATLTAGGGTTLSTGQFSTGDVISATGVSTAQIAGDVSGLSTRSIVGSTASISDNITTGTAIANIGTSSIVLDAGTELTSNAALAAQQGNSADVTATATSDFGNSALMSPVSGIVLTGDVANSTLAIDNNTTLGSAMGNLATNALSVTATTIDRADSTAQGSTNLGFTTATTFATGADFAALNLQTQTGDILADVDNFGNVRVVGTMTDSSASLSGNALQGDAMSNNATNRITLDGSAGITDTTTALGSVQTSVGNVGTDLDANFQIVADLTTSSAAIDGNQGFAAATSNRVVNEVSLAGNSISGEATTFGNVGVTLEPQVGSQALADTSLSSVQTSIGAVVGDSRIVGRIGLGTSPITGSSASVSDNFARAFGMGNEGVNRLGIDADTSFAGTTALTGTQVQIGDVSASAEVDADITTISGGSLTGSSAAIDSNIAFARTMGNDQTNALTIDATTIAGISSAATDSATIAQLGGALADNRAFTGDNIVSNFQGLRGNVTGSATVDGNLLIADDIGTSSVSASENIAQSNVTGNRGNNLLDLNAATSVTGLSALASEQTGRDVAAISSTATLNFDINQVADTTVTSGALNVDGNVGFSSAFANDVTNRLNVSGTSVVGQKEDLSVAGISATGVGSADADNLLGNFQSRSDAQAVGSTATLTVDLLENSTNTTESLTTSSLSVQGNTLDSTATSNRARNTLALNADTALTAGGALANSQISDSPVTSDVRLQAGVGNDDFGSITGSSVSLSDNTGVARASGNDAANVLNARGSTGITGETGLVAGGTVGADGVLNAQGTFAVASNQLNTGAVTAQAGFGAVGDATSSSLDVRSGALVGSSVAISGNRLVADAVSNRVENRLTVNSSQNSSDVTTALTSRQVATGAVDARVDGTRFASVNDGAVTSSSLRLNGNTLSASAGGNVATSRLIRD